MAGTVITIALIVSSVIRLFNSLSTSADSSSGV